MNRISRREFGALVGAAAVVGRGDPFAARQNPASARVTARDVVERIQKNVGVEWKTETVDTIKAGDSSTGVTGIVTTSMATLAVLQQAVKIGANLVITGEPTFYSRADGRNPPAGRGGGPAAQAGAAAPPQDRVFAAKNTFIESSGVVVFRLSDHWKLRKPDPLVAGIATALLWTTYQATDDPLHFVIPALSLEALARQVKPDLGVRGGMRVIGDPKTPIRRVGLLPGSTPIQAALKMLPAVDVIIGGEVREWESVEYVRDTAFSRGGKGLILLGRVVSEEPGMRACATWLQGLVPEVPVRHIGAGDPYWRPA